MLGKLFCLSFCPNKPIEHAVLVVPPFAEEMNKSRRMLAEQCRRLAQRGMHALLPDVYGTGDSEGEFSDASWTVWIDDLNRCYQWLRVKGAKNISIVTMRSGCLLAVDFIHLKAVKIKQLIMWQPVVSGNLYLTQFLRLKLATEMMVSAGKKTTINDLKQKLLMGESIEVAGYLLAPAIANEMAKKSVVDNSFSRNMLITWVDIVADSERDPTVVSRKAVKQLQDSGAQVRVSKVVGLAFWSATEIVEIPSLIELTLSRLLGIDDA